MHDSVAKAWPVFCERWEDRCSWLYLDNKELPTTGLGFRVFDVPHMASLPWLKADGTPATAGEKSIEWAAINARTELAPKGGRAFEAAALLRLSDSTINALLMETTAQFWKVLARSLPAIESWPADAQLAVLDTAYQNGPAFLELRTGSTYTWAGTRAGLLVGDFELAASHVPGTGDRADARRRLYRNAARALALKADPAVLWDTKTPTAPVVVAPPVKPPATKPAPKPKPAGATLLTSQQKVTFEGRRTTVRTVRMIQEARRIYTAATGQPGPRLSQGGYNAGGVAASAGTHDRDGIDFATANLSAGHARAWEKALGQVGFAAWWRRYIPGTWPQHHHGVPKGGDLSRGADKQTVSYRGGRDGLARNRPYPAINAFRTTTWEAYQKAHKPKPVKVGYIRVGGKTQRDLTALTVTGVNHARAVRGKNYRETWYVQTWLAGLNLYKGPIDGTWGQVTQAALDRFRDLRHTPDRRGPVTLKSLHRLRDSAKDHKVTHSNRHVYR